MAVTPRTLTITPTRISSQPAGKPVANPPASFVVARVHPIGHRQPPKRQAQQAKSAPAVAHSRNVRRSRRPTARGAGTAAAPARISPPALSATVSPSRHRCRSRSAYRRPRRHADHDEPGHPGDHRRRRPAPRPPPTGPGVHGRGRWVVGAACRRVRHNASTASSGSSASPTASPARYSELEAKVSVMVPGSPAGTTQPCCHPLTATGVSRAPVLVRATQPGLMLSGMTSTREVADAGARTSRRSGPHAPVCGA